MEGAVLSDLLLGKPQRLLAHSHGVGAASSVGRARGLHRLVAVELIPELPSIRLIELL